MKFQDPDNNLIITYQVDINLVKQSLNFQYEDFPSLFTDLDSFIVKLKKHFELSLHSGANWSFYQFLTKVPLIYDSFLTLFADRMKQLALEQNDPLFQFFYAVCLESGRGAKKDFDQAEKFYTFSMNQNFSVSFNNLATIYASVPEKSNSVKEFYKKSSELKNSRAMENLAFCYLTGENCKVNIKKAVNWLKKSASYGNSDSLYNLGNLYMGYM